MLFFVQSFDFASCHLLVSIDEKVAGGEGRLETPGSRLFVYASFAFRLSQITGGRQVWYQLVSRSS